MFLTRSPKVAEGLEKLGIRAPYEALCHYPYRYEDFSYTPYKAFLEDKERVVLLGRAEGGVKTSRFRGHMSKTAFSFSCVNGGLYQVVAWNQPYLSKVLSGEGLFSLVGTYDYKRREISLSKLLKGEIKKEDSLRPLYRLPSSVPQHTFVSLLSKGIENPGPEAGEVLPAFLREKYRLIPHLEALRRLHFPTSWIDVREASRTLKYEEALAYEVANVYGRRKEEAHKEKGKAVDLLALKDRIKGLGYSLTGDQLKALREIVGDMEGDSPMYRLLQGDVGTGKTLVAALAMYAEATRGMQSALLAPTESLAEQHYSVLRGLFPELEGRITLLTGGLDCSSRKKALEDLSGGKTLFAVGTHALFSKDVVYSGLGLAVIDEQHKFGVRQRRTLLEKGRDMDLLLMSATPIPRTLALTVYGDLEISTIREFPGGKRDVTTLIASPNDKDVYKAVLKQIDEGRRVYVVAPEIEEGEDKASSVLSVYRFFDRLLPKRIALMHGKRKREENEAALLAFKSGISPILVATNLIEVGIDVKEASMMLVYNPTHFSLSGLHQLRGRIGRDGSPSCFYLLYKGNDEKEMEKLNVLVGTSDGFKIAEADLRLRGPGDIAGTAQSGLPEFALCSIIDDYPIFKTAREDASLLASNPKGIQFVRMLLKRSSSLPGRD